MKAKWPSTINVILNIWLRHSFKAGIETLPVYRSNSLSTWWYKIKNWEHLKLLRLKARLNYTYNSAGAPWGMAGCSAPHREHGNERRHGVRGQRVSWTGNTQYGERHYPVLLNCKIVHHGLLAVLNHVSSDLLDERCHCRFNETSRVKVTTARETFPSGLFKIKPTKGRMFAVTFYMYHIDGYRNSILEPTRDFWLSGQSCEQRRLLMVSCFETGSQETINTIQ